MNYYYSDGSSGAQGPYSKEELTEFYKEGVVSAECIVCPEGSQSWYPIATILAQKQPDSQPAPNQRPMQLRTTLPVPNVPARPTQRTVNGHAAREYLAKLRADSCYSTLRTVITILTVLSLLSLYGLAFLVFAGSTQIEGTGTAGPLLLASASAILGTVFVIACRQAALVLIDLADTQIEKNSQP
jgi:hypothetical protein